MCLFLLWEMGYRVLAQSSFVWARLVPYGRVGRLVIITLLLSLVHLFSSILLRVKEQNVW